MELNNEFTVAVPIEQAWELLTDIERIAPCMPGAALESVEDDTYTGVVKVKVGPVTTQYRGTVHFLERDGVAHKAVLRAEGRETRGQGGANATITAELRPAGTSTTVEVTTDLLVTGRVAQFGRGVLADVSAKLMLQFVDALEASLDAAPAPEAGAATDQGPDAGTAVPAPGAVPADAAPEGAAPATEPGGASSGSSGRGGARLFDGAEPEAVDLVQLAGGSVAKRVGVALGALLAVLALVGILRRARRD